MTSVRRGTRVRYKAGRGWGTGKVLAVRDGVADIAIDTYGTTLRRRVELLEPAATPVTASARSSDEEE